jgi:hypothetical protein
MSLISAGSISLDSTFKLMLVQPVMYELDEELDGGDVEAGYLGPA